VSKLAEQEPTTTGSPAADGPPRLSALHYTHEKLGARFVSRAGWQVPQTYTSPEDEAGAIREGVGVADLSSRGKLLVRGDADATLELLGDAFGVGSVEVGHTARIAVEGQADSPWDRSYLARLVADEFLLFTPPGAESEVARRVEEERAADDLFLTVVDGTSGLAGLAVVGPAGREILSKLCALPLNARDFPNQRVAQGSLAKAHAIFVRNDVEALPAFELYVERPYGEYVWMCVMDAGREFGIIPFGWGARVGSFS
jgi:heterotetrameric sarcosine oxidase gamma subunit